MSTIFDKLKLCIQPSSERAAPVARSGIALPHVCGPLSAGDARMQEAEADNDALGRQLLEALEQFTGTPAVREEPVVGAPTLAAKDVLPALPFDIEAALAAVEHASTEEEAMAAVAAFLAGAETMVKVSADPIAALTTVFGTECVADVTEVYAAAVVDLEAEAEAAGGTITDRAASCIARSMVRQLTMRASRTMARAPRAHRALHGRGQRAPRSRRAHRRAVRLAAVASAGDGPPPAEPPPATHAPDGGRVPRAAAWSICSTLPVRVAHVGDPIEQAVEATP